LYNTLLSLADAQIVMMITGGSNNFSLSYGGSKRGGEFEIVLAHFSSEIADRTKLKLCTMLYYHLEMYILSGQEDPIIFL
jgi:hypothetical protein